MKKTAYIKYFFLASFALLSIMLLSGCYPSANQLLAEGKVAYNAQNYHSAFNKILDAARKGNTQAQYTVGYMYYYGIGTRRDMQHAIAWLDYAARHGDPRAIRALQLLQQ